MFIRLLMQDFAAFVTGQMDVGSEGEKEESSYRDASASKTMPRLTYNFNRRGGYSWPPWKGDEDYR